MNEEFAYIFKKEDNNYVISDLIIGRYDEDMELFIDNKCKIYRHVLFSGNKVGFGLRKCIIDIDMMKNSRFYFEMIDNNFCLISENNDKTIICNDIDLDNFNSKYHKLCDEIKERKLVKLKNNKGI